MGKLEDTLAQGVEYQKIPHAVVFATNADGDYLPTPSYYAKALRLNNVAGSWTYKHEVGKQVHGSSSEDSIGEDAEFMLASQTKLLTTIAVLQAVEKGLVGLDDDIDEKIPELSKLGIFKGFDGEDKPIFEAKKNTLTLRLLLTHSSGCVYDAGHPDLLKYNQQRDPTWVPNVANTIVKRFAYPLVFEPGTSWSYGTSIDWAGKVLERLTGQTLEQLVQDGIAKPLGITSMTFFPYEKAELGGKVPSLTARMPDGKLMLHTEPFMNIDPIDAMGGHGGYSNLEDYTKVQRSILANDGKLLKSETVDMMFTPQLTPEAAKGLTEFMKTPYSALFIGEWKLEMEVNWGLGGILLMNDGDGRRKEGTLSWGGVANTFWTIDREADLALTFGTQVLPPGDKGVEEMISAVEWDLYQRRKVKF